jgi:pimeloyl-ACP methyl ester carboxylesterase
MVFHGTPGSRLEQHSGSETYDRLGVRLIGVDRPGLGLSDPLPGRAIHDWPDDVVQLADALGLDRFFILGYSGGGPYAAACALSIPQRLNTVGIVSTSAAKAPADEAEATAPEQEPYGDTSWAETFRRDPGAFIDGVFGSGSDAPITDRRILERPEVRAWLVASVMEAFRQGIDGPVHDVYLMDRPWNVMDRPWGLDPSAIRAPVCVWHGELDDDDSVETARFLARVIPECRAFFYSGEGHLLIFEREEAILATLLGTA